MKTFVLLTISLLFALSLTQCVEKSTPPVPSNDTYSDNDTMWLQVGEIAVVADENLEVGFDRVVEDSRCPVGCIPNPMDPGSGITRLWLKIPGRDTIFVTIGLLGTDHAVHESQIIPADTLGLRFSLIALYPYPVNRDPIPQENYLAGIEVKTIVTDISLTDAVIITDLPPDSIELDPFDLRYVYAENDSLLVHIKYSGGCEEHGFELYMSPPVFAESNPVQADLYLRHDAAGDVCRALINRELKFDLRPIARLYQDMYGHLDPIQVNVYYYRDSYGQKKSDIYFPGDPGK